MQAKACICYLYGNRDKAVGLAFHKKGTCTLPSISDRESRMLWLCRDVE